MKKHLIYILIGVIVCGVLIFFTTQTSPVNKKGITFNRQFQRIDISTVHESEKPYSILMDPSYTLLASTVEEDPTLPAGEENFANEYSFKANLTDETQAIINLKLTVRLFPNGDAFIIVRTFSEDSIMKPFQYSLLIPGINYAKSEIWSLNYHGGPKLSEMITTDASMDSYEGIEGLNLLPATLNYVETLNAQSNITLGLLMGPMGIFKEKELNLVQLMSQKQQPLLELSKSKPLKVSFSFQLNPFNRSENWFFISKKRLLNYRDEKTLQNMLSADFSMKKKISFDGIYHIATASSYMGASDVTYDYYYNYAMWEGRRFMDLSKEKPTERFFYDMYLNSLYSTIKGANKYGYWISNVKSKYLWDSYEIPEGYVDTRYCTDAGFFLLKAYTEEKIKSAINAGQKFGDYLIEKFEASDGIKTGQKGFFFYDYYQPGQKKVTHASLNHILSELNYLYELYLSTHNEKYLGLAESILEGIRQTQDLWIRKEGEWRFRDDLWYAVYPVSSGLVFKSLDYTKTLTYEDLLKTQNNYRIIYNKEEPVIQKLILSKRSFLLKEGFQLKE